MTPSTFPTLPPGAPVAVIGMSCRLPAAANLDEFRRGGPRARDAAYEPVAGPHLDAVDLFDSAWFGISDAEAAVLDPRRRLALEAVVEAIDDAGIGYRIRGSGTAVVAAIGPTPGYGRGGAGGDFAQGISHVLGLHGPGATLEISGGEPGWAEAVARAFEDASVPFVIVAGADVEILAEAKAGGGGRVHVGSGAASSRILHARNGSGSVAAAWAGRSAAGGAPVSEIRRRAGGAVLILQRLADAVRTGSRVYAEIDLLAVDSMGAGRSRGGGGVTEGRPAAEPSPAHTSGSLLVPGARSVHRSAADSMSGSGAARGSDADREPGRESTFGAASAGGSMPATRSIVTVIERVCEQTDDSGARAGGDTCEPSASAVRSPIVVRPTPPGPSVRPTDPPVLITVTGRDGGEFRNAALRLVHHLRCAAPEGDRTAEYAALHALSAATTRSFPQATRGAVLAADAAQARERLRALAQGEPGPGIVGPRTTRRRGGVMFLFTGTAERPARLGRALAARYPVFAAALNEMTDAVVAAGGPRIWTPRFGFHPAGAGCAEDELGLPAGFVHQVALARLLESWGVRPDAVCGYGFGELAAGVVAGVLTPADGARLAVRWAGRAGAMPPDERVSALVGASPEEVARLIEPLRPAVAVAAVHGPRSVLVRGEPRQVETLARRAERRGLTVVVPADSAAAVAVPPPHSAPSDAEHEPGGRHVRPEQLGLGTPRVPFYSTVRAGEVFTTCAPDGHYWTEETGGAVHLAAAMARAVRDGVGTVLEFATHPALVPALREYPEFADSAHPVGDRDDEVAALLLALAELHADGRFVEWSGQGPFTAAAPRRRWRRTPVRSPLPLVTDCAAATVDAGETGEHALGAVALVPTGYWVRTLLRLAAPAEMMTDFVVHDRLGPDALGAIECRDDGPAGLRAYIDEVPVVSARPLPGPTPADIVAWMRVVDTGRSARHRMRELGSTGFYALLRRNRLEYGPRRRVLGRLETGGGHAFATVETVAANLVSIVEGCLHLLVAAAPEYVSDRTWPSVPAISAVWVGTNADRLIARAYATVRERGPDSLLGDVVGTDDEGVPVLALSGVRIVFAERDADAGDEQPEIAPFRTQVWLPVATGTDAPPSRMRRLLVVGASETAARLARSTDLTVPTEHVATAPDAAGEVVWAAAEAVDPPTGIVLVWPDGDDPEPAAALARAHTALTRACAAAGLAGLTVVLPRRALRGSGGAATAWGVAALTRTLRLESRRRVRVVWTDTDPRAVGLLADLVTIDAPGGRRAEPLIADSPGAEAVRAVGEPLPGPPGPNEAVPVRAVPNDSVSTAPMDDSRADAAPSSPLTSTSAGDSGSHVAAGDRMTGAAPGDSTIGTAPDDAGTHAAPDDSFLNAAPGTPLTSTSAGDPSPPVAAGDRMTGAAPGDSGTIEFGSDVLWAGDLRVGADGLAVRRFRQAPAVGSPAPRIDPGGTYVVTGGLGRRGAIAVRWLLDAGAHDVVVLTRDPRPVPGPLDGLEDRFVVVRCDVADRAELASALDDIREYGSTIRGVVHAAEDFEPAAFGAVTPDHLARLFAPKAEAARYLLELTSGDPIDFVLLFSSAAGALGARNQAGYAAASAALDALAAGSRRRRVLALGWEIRQSEGATAITDNDPAKVARGAHVLTQALRSGAPHLLVSGEIGAGD
ncbi:KR domain-containing protein [Nocardia higoensis]|uniref:KR domain-containing protein n=1 Tax=Nocardia higoensis TaxID=228599 RepID=UPI0002F9A87E|nr:KR domain-containing protein [Nocardia higoensis]